MYDMWARTDYSRYYEMVLEIPSPPEKIQKYEQKHQKMCLYILHTLTPYCVVGTGTRCKMSTLGLCWVPLSTP